MASQIKVNEIIKQSGSSISIGESGDTINIAGSAYAAAGDNTPMFHAYMSSNQSISNGTNTKIAFNSERIDTDSAFDTSNNRFVVPSGAAGKYVFTYWVKMPVDDAKIVQLILYKNGSELSAEETRANFFSSASGQQITSLMSFVDTASASDYYEVFIYQNNGSSANAMQESSGFMGYKLIG